MATPSTIAITPGSGQLLDAVSVMVGPNTVVRETMVIADPTSPTQLAGVTAGGALLVDGSAVTQPVSIVGTVPISGTVSITGSVAVTGTFWQATQPVSGTITANQGTSPWIISGAVIAVGSLTHNNAAPSTNNIGALTAIANAAAPTYTEGDQVLLSTDLSGAIRVNATFSGTVSQNLTQVGGADINLGQQLAAASLPVVLTALQITALTPPTAAAIGTAVSADLLIGTQAAASSVPVALPTATITTLTPPTAAAIAAAIVSNPPTVGIAAAQKIEIYDGTNTAAVKAASVAATATDPALVVVTNGSVTAGACALTTVTSTSSVALAANTARREFTIVNTDIVPIYLGLGQTPTATAYHIVLSPCTVAHDGTGGSYTSSSWKGAVNAIAASTSGHVVVLEMT